MEKLNHYRELIKRRLNAWADLDRRATGENGAGAESFCVFDDERGHYLFMTSGWVDRRRIRPVTLHVRIKDGKIWVEDDMTEEALRIIW